MLEVITPTAATAAVAIPASDAALLHLLAHTIVAAGAGEQRDHCGALPYVMHARDDNGHAQRIVFFQRPYAVQHSPCTFVGFIGKKQASLNHQLVDEVISADEVIMEAMIGQKDMLGYASLELPDRNWCNLVLFRHHEAIRHVREQTTHRYASQVLAPRFYAWIHLYQGQLPAGLVDHHATLAVIAAHRYTFGSNDESTAN